jgi:hypothetical protein
MSLGVSRDGRLHQCTLGPAVPAVHEEHAVADHLEGALDSAQHQLAARGRQAVEDLGLAGLAGHV